MGNHGWGTVVTTKEQHALPDLIRTFFVSWETVRATDAAAAGVQAPAPYCPFDCAVRFGAVDSLGQAVGLDRKLAFTALAVHLGKVAGGREIFGKIMATASRPDLVQWINDGGQAVHAALTKQMDDFQAFGPIAERIRREALAARAQE
jgi:hypothetical protein